ncbi:MAG: aminotransferase class I/II-fold pyridoxal phosphate-dependent enzyme [Sporolactobacillus sp.]
MTLNKWVESLQVSEIRQFEEQTKNIPDILKLTLGEPDFNTPERIKQAAIQAIHDNYSHYSAMGGDKELRQAASRYFEKKYDLHYSVSEIIVTVGATEAIAVSLKTIINSNERILIPTPAFPAYAGVSQLLGAPFVLVDTSAVAFKLTPELLQHEIDKEPTIKAVVLNFPNNPTGVTYTKDELKALVPVLRKNDLYVISDEIYSELDFSGYHVSMAAFYREKTILINGLSKSHAMTGWRIGFLMAPAPLAAELIKVHQFYVTGATTIAQRAAITALNACENAALPMREAYIKRKDYLMKELSLLGFEIISPQGGFYLFAEIPRALRCGTAFAFCLDLAKEAKVSLIPGSAFGTVYQGYVRFSFAASFETLHEAIKRIRHYTEQKRVQA